MPFANRLLIGTIVLSALGNFDPAHAQPIADSVRLVRIIEEQKKLEEQNKTFKFGLSLGHRLLAGKRSSFYRDAVLDPRDSVVRAELIDKQSIVLSGVVVAYPWKRSAAPERREQYGHRHYGNAWRLGFTANIDLASFSNDQLSTFNRSIEGGGGLAYRLSDEFSLALTYERIFSRRLRTFVVPDEKLPVGPASIEGSFDREKETYFMSDNLSAVSIKFVYFFK